MKQITDTKQTSKVHKLLPGWTLVLKFSYVITFKVKSYHGIMFEDG